MFLSLLNNLKNSCFNFLRNLTSLWKEPFDFKARLAKHFKFNPGRADYYQTAFTHRSSQVTDYPAYTGPNNERLEFLGDAVLGLVVAEYLFYKFPEREEGFLTDMRSKIVNRSQLEQVAKDLEFEKFIVYDKSLDLNFYAPVSLYGDAFEAFFGAMFLDKGFVFTQSYLFQVLDQHLDLNELLQTAINYKSKLIEWCQQQNKQVNFSVNDNQDANNFKAVVKIDGKKSGEGIATRKKFAEQEAARDAVEKLAI